MSVLDRATLKAAFQNGDQPQGSDYENLIDSLVNLAETTTQTMNGQLVLAGGISAASVNTGTITATGTFSGASVNFTTGSADTIYVSALIIRGNSLEVGTSTPGANIFWTATATTTFAGANTFTTAAAVTSAASSSMVSFTSPENGVALYIGPQQESFLITAALSFTVGGNNKLVSFRLMKNADTKAKSTTIQTCPAGADHHAAFVQMVETLASGDRVRLAISNNTDTTDVTLRAMNLAITRH